MLYLCCTHCTKESLSSYVGELEYISIWSEHHEDILCKKETKKYDAFQIKTLKAENGPWTLNNDALKKSLKRFHLLESDHGSEIDTYFFISNASFLDPDPEIKDQNKLSKSPIKFIESIKLVTSIEDIDEYFRKKLKSLSTEFEIDENEFFKTLQKVKFKSGPTREDFDSVLSHDHIPKIESCKNFNPDKLNSIRDLLVNRFFQASSLHKSNGNTYWHFINEQLEDPEITGKRITPDIIDEVVSNVDDPIFKYSPGLMGLELGGGNDHSKLRIKMSRGGLDHYYSTMKRRSISTEEHLIKMNYQSEEDFSDKLNQITSVVESTCSDEHAQAIENGAVDGLKMYQNVIKELRKIADQNPEKIENQDSDVLIGVAGLLTDDCKVWWSEKFNLEDSK
jgi:hypothetical protein